ncbi:MAG: hypothetical protein OQK45_09005 [Sulfurovum sp.]|nr:hypothetical protein [Sulfurovum sp.]
MKNILFIVLLSVFGLADDDKHTNLACEFASYATAKGSFNDDVMKFTIITNDTNGTFTMKRSNGVFTIGNTIRGDKGLSFLEVSELGNITTTTMAVVPPVEDRQEAVYSMNILVGGKLLARQYYGTCQRLNESQTKKVRFLISKEKRDMIYKKLHIERELKKLSKKDAKIVLSALNGVFPSKIEMEQDMSIEGMILVSKIMDSATK